jgi:hypothetical protein
MGADAKEVIQAVEVDPLDRNRDISGQEDIEVPPSLAPSLLLAYLVKAWCKFTFQGRNSKVWRIKS